MDKVYAALSVILGAHKKLFEKQASQYGKANKKNSADWSLKTSFISLIIEKLNVAFGANFNWATHS